MKPQAILILYEPEHRFKNRRYFLRPGNNTVGSCPSCNIWISDDLGLPKIAAFFRVHETLLTLSKLSNECSVKIMSNLDPNKRVEIEKGVQYVLDPNKQFRIGNWRGVFKAIEPQEDWTIINGVINRGQFVRQALINGEKSIPRGTPISNNKSYGSDRIEPTLIENTLVLEATIPENTMVLEDTLPTATQILLDGQDEDTPILQTLIEPTLVLQQQKMAPIEQNGSNGMPQTLDFDNQVPMPDTLEFEDEPPSNSKDYTRKSEPVSAQRHNNIKPTKQDSKDINSNSSQSIFNHKQPQSLTFPREPAPPKEFEHKTKSLYNRKGADFDQLFKDVFAQKVESQRKDTQKSEEQDRVQSLPAQNKFNKTVSTEEQVTRNSLSQRSMYSNTASLLKSEGLKDSQKSSKQKIPPASINSSRNSDSKIQRVISVAGFKLSPMQKIIINSLRFKLIEQSEENYDVLLVPEEPKISLRLLKAMMTKKDIKSVGYINKGTGKIHGKIFGQFWHVLLSRDRTNLFHTYTFFVSSECTSYKQLIEIGGGRVLETLPKQLKWSDQPLKLIVGHGDEQIYNQYREEKQCTFHSIHELARSIVLAELPIPNSEINDKYFQ